MITGEAFARQSESAKYEGVPYSKLDCQAFVEKVLYDCGVRNSQGLSYNWRGSNSMWRTALSWKGTLEECKAKFGSLPIGAWVFIVKDDGGEKERGYHDSEGNATHVGIYIGNDEVMDSTRTAKRDGVGKRQLKGFNRIGLCKYIDYNNSSTPADNIDSLIILAKKLLEGLEALK